MTKLDVEYVGWRFVVLLYCDCGEVLPDSAFKAETLCDSCGEINNFTGQVRRTPSEYARRATRQGMPRSRRYSDD